MPLMVMPRSFTVRTIYGATIAFTKDEPTNVIPNPKVIEECLKYGASYAEKSEIPTLPDEGATPTNLPKTPSERTARIVALMEEMRDNAEAHRTHFTAANRPNAKYVQSTLGFDVSGREVEELWKPIAYPKIGEEG